MEKQLQFKAFNEQGQLVIQPLFLERGLEKTAEALEMRSKLHPRVQDFVRSIRPTGAGVYVLVNALGASEYWGANVNGDAFPEKALVHSPPNWDEILSQPEQARLVGKSWPYGYPTFMAAHAFKHHQNKDPSRAFGRIDLATWNPIMHRVELVVYLDRALCMQFDAIDIIDRIENGEFPDVSMGTKVPYDVCSICGNHSKTRNDYCQHALTMMNRILPDGRKVCVINTMPRFFDISFVFIGADKTAKVMAKLAQKGNQICMGDFCTIPRLSAEVGEVFPKEAMTVAELGLASSLIPAAASGIVDRDWRSAVGAGAGGLIGGIAGTALTGHAGIGLAGSAGGSLLGRHLMHKEKKADPVDELQSNIGVTKEKAQAEQDRTKGIPSLLKLSPSMPQASWDKFGAFSKLAEELELDRSPQVTQDELVRQGVASPSGSRYRTLGAYLKEKTANDPIKKKIKVQGVPIWLEWLKGETREYKKGGVVKYHRLMEADYGYIPGTIDSDGEELDTYIGPDRSVKNAYVIRQLKKTGGFDEHKVMIGYSSKGAAKASYVHHMGGTPERFGGIQAIPLRSLVALFGDNKGTKEKVACDCHGVGDDCGGSLEKLGAIIFPISKSASHAKLSEIIKSLPAGPFTKETLPKLESTEKNIPSDVLDMMGGLPLGAALSTPTMAGMVLKPHEFQRIMLISIGERPLADELDNKGMTFGSTKDVDDSLKPDEGAVDHDLLGILKSLGLIKDRSVATPALASRATAASADKPFHPLGSEKTASGPLMAKLAASYNGYRRNILRKAASISNFMTTDPQLRSELFGSSMAEAFAGGIDKVATSVLSPDSLAYLVGAYTDRDLHITQEIVSSLALTGVVVEAA